MRERFRLQMAAYHADVGRRIRDARERNRPGLSQEEAAHELGVTAKTIGRWERGESTPRGKQWEPLATMLGVDVEELRGAAPVLPEEELRAQLVRIEDKLDAILTRMDLAATTPQTTAPATRQEAQTKPSAKTRKTTRAQAP